MQAVFHVTVFIGFCYCSVIKFCNPTAQAATHQILICSDGHRKFRDLFFNPKHDPLTVVLRERRETLLSVFGWRIIARLCQ